VDSGDIWDGLRKLVAELEDFYGEAHHEYRCVGNRRETPTEVRVWLDIGLFVQVMARTEIDYWRVMRLHDEKETATWYHPETKRYRGRGWKDRLIHDVMDAVVEAANDEDL